MARPQVDHLGGTGYAEEEAEEHENPCQDLRRYLHVMSFLDCFRSAEPALQNP